MQTINNFLSNFNYYYFFADPIETKYTVVILSIFLILLVLTVVARILLPVKIEKKDPRWSLYKFSFWIIITLVILGLMFLFFRYEALPFFSRRIFIYLDFTLMIIYSVAAFVYFKKFLPSKIYNFKNQKRKEKWLPKKR